MSVGIQFGVGKSTMGAVIQVSKVINAIVLQRTVTLGNVDTIMNGFAAMGFPKQQWSNRENADPHLGPRPPCKGVYKLQWILLHGAVSFGGSQALFYQQFPNR